MNLKQLETFLTLSKIKNFTKTAEQLHYAQSNVTTQIQQLETELGIQLFERIGKNVLLTPEGETLIPYAVKMLTLSSQIKEVYSTPMDSKRIVIGAAESLSIYKLPLILKEYRKEYPDVELFIKLLDTGDILPLFSDNSIDIALVLGTPIKNNSIVIPFSKPVPIWVLSAKENYLASKKEVGINDFEGCPVIFTLETCCYRKQFQNELNNASVVPKIILETSSIQVIKETAISGLGACLLPKFTVERELQEGTISHIEYPTNYNIFAQLIHHKDKWVSPHLSSFIDTVQKYY